MNSVKTANILLIVLLVIVVFKTVWDIKFANDVADANESEVNGKNEDENTNGFFGTKSIARKLAKK